ncbi:MAG: 3-methyl-2-oxobutanoate hydroxymethyltransferase [Candidatus Manganitrophus sp. SB1]|nr:3-methyl-2-oxobutanoate hydroxymethyltransferase [Candidatus Manganitrophus morganii]
MDKITVPRIREKKENGEKITVLTAYDFPFAKLIDEAGIDILLVGDTVGIVVQGEESTLPVTLDQMIYHTRMVSRAAKRALVVGDMPFLSYQASIEETIRNAGRFLKEGGAAAVKLEGGVRVADRIEVLTRHDIPVMAHIGLTPQSVHRMGGYKVQGRGTSQVKQLLADAKTVESAGAFSLVLEGIPISLAKKITQSIKIPTIGIGAGPHCDGQVLVLHDLLGLFTRFHPKFVRRYADLTSTITEAVRRYKSDVESGKFPTEEEGYE